MLLVPKSSMEQALTAVWCCPGSTARRLVKHAIIRVGKLHSYWLRLDQEFNCGPSCCGHVADG